MYSVELVLIHVLQGLLSFHANSFNIDSIDHSTFTILQLYSIETKVNIHTFMLKSMLMICEFNGMWCTTRIMTIL